MDPALDNILRGDTRNTSTEEFGQLYPFGNLIFNHRLDILLLLLSAILPLDVFCQATTEIVGPVFFSNNIIIAGPRTTNLRSKVLNFRLELRPPDPVSPSLELLPPLLERDDNGIGGKCYKNVIRHVHRHARITHEAHMGEHTEDTICGGPLEDDRQDIERHPLVNIGPVIHCRFRIVFHDLISNRIRDII